MFLILNTKENTFNLRTTYRRSGSWVLRSTADTLKVRQEWSGGLYWWNLMASWWLVFLHCTSSCLNTILRSSVEQGFFSRCFGLVCQSTRLIWYRLFYTNVILGIMAETLPGLSSFGLGYQVVFWERDSLGRLIIFWSPHSPDYGTIYGTAVVVLMELFFVSGLITLITIWLLIGSLPAWLWWTILYKC